MGFRPRCGIKWSSGPDLHRPLAIIGRLLCCLSYRREIGTAPGNRTLPVGFGDQPVPLNICAVWCPRPVARRLPLFGRQPCISQHLSGMKTGGPEGSRALLRIPARDSRLYGTCRPKLVETTELASAQSRCERNSPLWNMRPHLEIGGDRRVSHPRPGDCRSPALLF